MEKYEIKDCATETLPKFVTPIILTTYGITKIGRR
jgi:hypothetical protein